MKEQLRKAIEEATRVEPWQIPYSIGMGRAVDELEHVESKAKLLRVIEMLVQQRDDLYELFDVVTPSLSKLNAELIAALEEK